MHSLIHSFTHSLAHSLNCLPFVQRMTNGSPFFFSFHPLSVRLAPMLQLLRHPSPRSQVDQVERCALMLEQEHLTGSARTPLHP